MASSQRPKPQFEEDATIDYGSWASRLIAAAQGGAPAIRPLLSANVELRVAFGPTWEQAQGATIVSEWLAGRFALARNAEVHPVSTTGNQVVARIDLGGAQALRAGWVLEATLGQDGAATTVILRTQGSA